MRHYSGRLTGQRQFFAKFSVRGMAGPFRSEADGLRWLADPAAVPLPDVLGCDQHALVISWIPQQGPDVAAARRFGAELADLHAAGADCFGGPRPGFIAWHWTTHPPTARPPGPSGTPNAASSRSCAAQPTPGR
ncbi:MAG TPA: fructosamine kinase family protein [Streptosporangiaceae bacterium]